MLPVVGILLAMLFVR